MARLKDQVKAPGKLLAACAVAAVSVATPTMAQDAKILLENPDTGMRLEGTLLAFENGEFSIATTMGDLTVPAVDVVCTGLACPQRDATAPRVSFAGSPSMTQQLIPLLVTGYAEQDGAAVETLPSSGTGGTALQIVDQGGFGDPIQEVLIRRETGSGGFNSLLEKSTDITASSRRILRDEAMALREDGAASMVSTNSERVIAVDSLAVITHPDNPVGAISMTALAQIFRSEITNWAQLGGPNAPIHVYARGRNSGARFTFDQEIMGEAGATISARSLTFTNDDKSLAAAVYADPYGIGYVSYSALRGTKAMDLVNACGLTQQPGPFASKAEEYPLSRRMYLYARQDNLSDDASELLAFTESPNADPIIEKVGFYSLRVDRADLDQTRSHLDAMVAGESDDFVRAELIRMADDMAGWDRLSSTFRFGTGQLRLDNKGLRDVDRLLTYLEAQDQPVEVAFVGFTDNSGVFESNRDLSLSRAQETADQIKSMIQEPLENVSFSTKGFGQLAPVGCNDTSQGRATNRRVEVWIRPKL